MPREQRRAELLDAARALFVARGIAGTSLEDITHRAGVSKGLFYVYFRSKDDLIAALQENFSRDLTERIRAAGDRETDWGAKLDASVKASFACYRELHDLHEVLFRRSVPDTGDPDREPAHILITRTLCDILTAGIAVGAYRVEDPDTTAGLLYITMHAFDPELSGDVHTTDTRLLRATQQLFRRTAGIS